MAIDNPQATTFTEGYTRPISRQFLQLKNILDRTTGKWAATGVQPFFTGANASEQLGDQNGLTHPATGQDVIDWAIMVADIKAILDVANALDPIQRLATKSLLDA